MRLGSPSSRSSAPRRSPTCWLRVRSCSSCRSAGSGSPCRPRADGAHSPRSGANFCCQPAVLTREAGLSAVGSRPSGQCGREDGGQQPGGEREFDDGAEDVAGDPAEPTPGGEQDGLGGERGGGGDEPAGIPRGTAEEPEA